MAASAFVCVWLLCLGLSVFRSQNLHILLSMQKVVNVIITGMKCLSFRRVCI